MDTYDCSVNDTLISLILVFLFYPNTTIRINKTHEEGIKIKYRDLSFRKYLVL